MEREKKITLLFMALEVQIMPGASKLHKECAFLSKCSPVNSFKIIITHRIIFRTHYLLNYIFLHGMAGIGVRLGVKNKTSQIKIKHFRFCSSLLSEERVPL